MEQFRSLGVRCLGSFSVEHNKMDREELFFS